jgi:RNA polymerase sigma factor (sigma-70 family)
MSCGQVNRVMQRIRAVAIEARGGDLTDGQLLEWYLAGREEAAFTALVQRHGPMVLGVCRRVLNHAHDAEDAFQATFLVLVRKAATVRPRERVGNWLYGVAYRTALEARGTAARRRIKERTMSRPEAAPEDVWQDVRPVLDQELANLPEKYRSAVVLCDLEGKTRKEAARQLGWPEGTVAGRLTRARAILARRLGRHGIVLSAAALAAYLPNTATAAVPASLMMATTRAATWSAVGSAAVPGVVPAKVAALTEGVLKAMLFAKLRAALAVALVLGLMGLVAGLGSYHALAGDGQAAGIDVPQEKPLPKAAAQKDRLPDNVGDADGGDRLDTGRELPEGPAPTQALFSLAKDGTLLVRTSTTFYQPVSSINADGARVTSYRAITTTRTESFDLSEVTVRETHGQKLDPAQVRKRLKGVTPALIYWGQKEVDPLHLRLIKDGTLVFNLPMRPVVVPAVPPVAPAPALPPAPVIEAVPPLSPPPAPLPRKESEVGHPDDTKVFNTRMFKIPFQVAPSRNDVVHVRLWVSTDKGKSWRVGLQHACSGNGDPLAKAFIFTAPKDGLYWFAVQSVSRDEAADPPVPGRFTPELRVIVSTPGEP